MSSERALVLTALLLSACADFERGEPATDAGASTSNADGGSSGDGGATVTFGGVHPLLLSGCQSCHRTGGAAGSTGFLLSGAAAGDLSATVASVDTSNPAASRLLRKAAGQGHGGGSVFAESSPEYQTLLTWISAGARP